MGIFNVFGRRREDEIRDYQREEARINKEFREMATKKISEQDEEINNIYKELDDYKESIRELRSQISSLRRDKSFEAEIRRRKVEEELEIAKQEKERKEKEKNLRENEKELSESEYREAQKYVAQIKKNIESAIEENNEVRLEVEEKKLKENLLIFKKRFAEEEYKKDSLKKLKLVSEILFNLAEYYYNKKLHKKALEFYLEMEEFQDKRKIILLNRIVRCSYESGKYEEALKYLQKYSENSEKNTTEEKIEKNILDENLLKLELYIKINKYKEAREVILKLNDIFREVNDKFSLKVYIEYVIEYIEEKKEEDIILILFFYLLYLKDFEKIEKLLKKVDFKEKEFFKGIILLRKGKKEEGVDLIKKYRDTIYGIIIYLSNKKLDILDEDIIYLDNFLNKTKEQIYSEKYILKESDFYDRKYEAISYKIDYLFCNRKINFNVMLNEITSLLENDERDRKYKGNNLFWASILKIVDYLKKTDNLLSKDFEKILFLYLTEEEIEYIKDGVKDFLDIDIEKEYRIIKEKSEKSIYREAICENMSTKKNKVLIELFEPMNIKSVLNKKIALNKDKIISEKRNHYLKIDNFSIINNNVKIITEMYDNTYEEVMFDYYNLTFEEKMKKAFNLIEAFKELEEEKIIFSKFNIDNLVIKDDEFLFRILNFSKEMDNGTLNSTKTSINKKSNRYRTPEILLKDKTLESNTFILGLLLYDVFYGEDILKGILDPSLSKKQIENVKDAFYEGTSIEKSLVLNNNSNRFEFENESNGTVKLRKVLEKYYIPKDLTELLEDILNSNKLLRPTIDSIEERLESIESNSKGFKGFIPNNILKSELKKFIKSIAKNINAVTVRDKKLEEIYSDVTFNENIPALIVIELKNQKKLEISDLGKIYTIILSEQENNIQIKDKEVFFEKIKKKIEQIINDETENELEEIAKKNMADTEHVKILFYYLNDRLDEYRKNNILKLFNEDVEIFKNIPTISNTDIKKVIKDNDIDILLKILNKIIEG